MRTSPAPEHRFANLIEEFFLERLIRQRNSSPQTVAAYRDCFRLLFEFARDHCNKLPDRLVLADLDAPLVLAFLDHLEKDRNNSIRSRNARLAALWGMREVIVTPHVSGFGPRYWERALEQFETNLRLHLAGEPLVNVVDKRAGY